MAIDELSFEKALEELEQLVAQLESGELSLEESLKLYERGVLLSRQCSRLLDAAERKIEVLRSSKEEDYTIQPFEYARDAETD